MKIVGTFAIVNKCLLAVQFDGRESDEFDLLFTKWQDIAFLKQFFEDNISDLKRGFFGDITVREAVFRTIKEAKQMHTRIKRIAKEGLNDSDKTLQDLVFTQLHKDDFSIQHLQSKAYGQTYHSWLRLYAVRIEANLYVVSGGAIKLTKTMQERSHLIVELNKLKATVEYLREEGLFDGEDYDFIEIGSHDKR